MYLITAYFDEKTNKRIQGWINKVSASTGNHFMSEHKVPPHLTLAAIEARDAEVLLPQFQKLSGTLEAGSVELVTVGALLPYVLYAAPVLNAYLKELHAKVLQTMADHPGVRISRYYQQASWFPHVTIGKTLDKEQMRIAFAAMQDSFAPLEGKITRIALSRVNPHEDIESIELISDRRQS